MTEPVIRSIPLHRLERSPANVRRTEAGKTAFAELKASIAAHGLLKNLVARSIGPGEDPGTGPGQAPGEHFAVIAGARRLAALNDLAREGAIASDFPVPCRVIENGVSDTELSLAENTVRVAMHPADQVEAFGALALAGATVADIAARFGVSERTVEQRLRLGHAAPELLDAYRENAIDLETLKAFAVTTDTARQVAVWEQVKDQGYRPTGWQIKRMLTDDRIPAGAALARYVGVDAYEAAGGPVLRDLFADEHENGVWLEDPALLMQLALDRLKVAADELATRWKWAEARLDVEWSDLARFGRVRPTPGEPTDEEKAEIERLHTRHDELVNMDEDAWTDELIEEAEAIEPRLEQIQDAIKARAVFRPEDIAIAGCIVTIGGNGELQLVQGLVKPEDMPADTDTATSGAAAHAGGEHDDGQQATSGIQSPAISGPAMPPARPDPEAEARKEAGVGIGLADDLRAIRTALVKARLAEDFGAAFDLMLFQMGRAVFTPGYHDHALDIAVRETRDRPPLRVNDDAFGDWSPGEAMLADRSTRSPSTGWRSRTAEGVLRGAPGVARGGQAAPLRRLRRAHGQRPARVRGGRPARARSHRRPPRHRVRGARPADRRDVLVARPQGPDAVRRPRGPRRRVGARPPQGQEGHAGRGDGDRVRQGRFPSARASRRRATPPRSPGRRPASAPSTQATSTTARPASRKRRLRTKIGPPHSRRPRRSSPSRPATPKLPRAGRPIRAMRPTPAPSDTANGAPDGEAIAPPATRRSTP